MDDATLRQFGLRINNVVTPEYLKPVNDDQIYFLES